jgi:hypothetical protein
MEVGFVNRAMRDHSEAFPHQSWRDSRRWQPVGFLSTAQQAGLILTLSGRPLKYVHDHPGRISERSRKVL